MSPVSSETPSSDDAVQIPPKDSPSPSPPVPDATNEDLLSAASSSRKREREASLEPVSTPKAVPDTTTHDYKDTRTPAKKNRRHLDSTREEDDESSLSRPASPSPPLSLGTTPSHVKMQVRKISQGVEDLTWKNIKKKSQEDLVYDAMLTDNAEATTDDAMQAESASGVLSSPDGLKRKHDDLVKVQVNGDTDSTDSAKDEPVKRARDSLDKDDTRPAPRAESPTKAKPMGFLAYANPVEPKKRPRDDADKDVNLRDTKRPSPPPEESTSAKPAPAAALSGFMAYASTSSPFASVKGQNIFSGSTSRDSSPFGSTASSSSSSTTTSTFKGTTSPKMGGFAAFASTSSPFATVAAAAGTKSPGFKASRRPKSPSRSTRGTASTNDAFSSYASQPSAFSSVLPKRTTRALSPRGRSSTSTSTECDFVSGSVFGSVPAAEDINDTEDDAEENSFGDRLRAGKDGDEESGDEDIPKMALQAQAVETGEEDEETMHQVRCKLFALSPENQWRERGTGTLKLNVRIADGGGARLVMRKEAVYTVLLNVTLFKGMQCTIAQDPRYLRFGVIENGCTTHYNLRVSSAKMAEELLEEIKANIPT